MNRILGGCYVLALNILLSAIIPFALESLGGGIKGGSLGADVMLGFGIFVFGLSFLSYYIGESFPRSLWVRSLWAFIPFIASAWLVNVIMPPEGGLILALQFVAIVLPSLWLRSAFGTLFSGIFSGVLFWAMCNAIRHFYIHPFGAVGDDWVTIFPFLVVLVSVELAVVRYISNQVLKGQVTSKQKTV